MPLPLDDPDLDVLLDDVIADMLAAGEQQLPDDRLIVMLAAWRDEARG